jgi:hypothetical protein
MNERHAPSDGAIPGDRGFTYRKRKNGDAEVLHQGRLASTLRGAEALDFLAEVEAGDHADGQQLMARVTGNYKRGNERTARNHPRNRCRFRDSAI